MLGCNADGQNVQCRHCGKAEFSHIHCPGSQVCDFPNIPTVPYYYEPNCTLGMLGCNADDVHTECRFCGEAPFESVPCPQPHSGLQIYMFYNRNNLPQEVRAALPQASAEHG